MKQGLSQRNPARSSSKRWLLRRFGEDKSGASALEFALVAGPLLLLLLAILQVGFVFLATFALESATERAARLIRTGQAQSLTASQFKTEVCKQVTAPLTCSGLEFDVRKYNSFAGAGSGLTQPLDGSGNMKNNFGFDPGKASDVMVVRAFYPLDIGAYLPTEFSLSNMAGNKRVLVATAAFRNEPF